MTYRLVTRNPAGSSLADSRILSACSRTDSSRPPPAQADLPRVAHRRLAARARGRRCSPCKPRRSRSPASKCNRTYAAGTRGYLRVLDTVPRPGTHRDLLVVTMGSIGVPACNAGRQVSIVDIGGLAEPLAARTSVISGRAAGHRKSVDPAWYDAEFGAERGDSNVAARGARSHANPFQVCSARSALRWPRHASCRTCGTP
jgi:hypothetical protein